MGRFRNALDTLSQIAFIVACFVLSGYVVVRLAGGTSTPDGPGAKPDVPYQAGEPVTPFQAASFSGSKATVVLFVRSTCTFCTQSMEFYRRIAGQRSTLASVQIIAAAPEPLPSLEQYLRSHNLNVDYLREMPKEGYKVAATPTLLLVNRQGGVIRSWQGALNDTQEKEFLQLLEHTAAAANSLRVPAPPHLSLALGLAR